MITTNGVAPRRGLEILDAGLPRDMDTEVQLLRYSMILPGFVEREEITADLFTDPAHQRILAAIGRLIEDCQPRDLPHLITELARTGALDEIGRDRLSQIITEDIATLSAPRYVGHAKELRARRELHLEAVEFLKALHGTKPLGKGTASHRERLDEITADANPFTIETMTSAEFDSADFSTSYLIEHVLAERQPLVIAAQLKSMKSTLAVAMAVALASGKPFLGRFHVARPCRVLLLNAESGGSTVKSTARRIAESYGTTLPELTGLHWGTKQLPRLDQPQELTALRQILVRHQTEVLIVDPLYFMLPGADAGNLMVVGSHLRRLSALAEELGITLVVVHHAKRSTGRDKGTPPELSDITWAGTAEWARQWLLLSRREDYEPGTGKHSLWAVLGGSAGHSGLYGLELTEGVGVNRTWTVDVLDPDEVRTVKADAADARKSNHRAAAIDKAKGAICLALRKYPDGETQKTIRDTAGLDGSAISREAFASLLEDGHILPAMVAKGKRTYEGYRLNENCQV